MKSQKNRLENDIASLEKRLDEDNLSETEKNQILDELAARKLLLFTKQKARLYDRKPAGKTRGENTKYFLNLEKRHYQKFTAVR